VFHYATSPYFYQRFESLPDTPPAKAPSRQLRLPGEDFSLRSANIDALIARIRLEERGRISEGAVKGCTNGGVNRGGEAGGEVIAEGIAPGHGVKLELCQFNKFVHG
jgi:hypothetical protein